MNILIFGIGGVGGFFGGKLAQTDHYVTFIARGKHLEAIRRNGLKVKSNSGDFTAFPDLATDNLEEIAPPDLVIFGVKSWQLAEAAALLKSYITKDTVILPLQNGADNIDKLKQILPEENILGGLCRIVSFVEAPGIINHPAFDPTITFGEVDNSQTLRIKQIKAIFDKAGIKSTIAKDIDAEIWKKFLFITMISGLGGLTRVPVGALRESAYLTKMMRDTAQEILSVAQAKNINIYQDDIENVFRVIAKQDPATTASTQRDIMDGKPSELEDFNGYIVKEGKKLGIPTPVNQMIYECLLPMEALVRANQ